MDIKRFWHSIRLYMMFNAKKRGDYVRQHNLFHHCGEYVRLPQMLLPLHSDLISIHDNVELASGAKLVVHDAIHKVLNAKFSTKGGIAFHENVGCIEIMENVFIGMNTVIIGNVRIGPDAVVGACSLINKDVPKGTVYAGIPAKQIGLFDDLTEKRKVIGTVLSKGERWKDFEQSHPSDI